MTIDPPAAKLKRILDKIAIDAAKVDTFQYKAASERSQFFEKLALLDGGAIVLSVTFLGYFLPKQDVIRSRGLLHGSWCLLLLSLLASLLRNYFYQNYVYDSRISPYIRKLAEKVEIEALVAIDPMQMLLSEDDKILTSQERADYATALKSKAQHYRSEAKTADGRKKFAERVWLPCEPVALASIFLGLAFLVWFAIINTR